jgi:hypothetical protein
VHNGIFQGFEPRLVADGVLKKCGYAKCIAHKSSYK